MRILGQISRIFFKTSTGQDLQVNGVRGRGVGRHKVNLWSGVCHVQYAEASVISQVNSFDVHLISKQLWVDTLRPLLERLQRHATLVA